jgi:hypothetical protein
MSEKTSNIGRFHPFSDIGPQEQIVFTVLQHWQCIACGVTFELTCLRSQAA